MDKFPRTLLYLPNLPHYRVPVLSHVNERIGHELIVSHGRSNPESHYITVGENSLPFKNMSTKTRQLAGGRLYLSDVRSAFKAYGMPDVVAIKSEIRNLSLLPLLLFCKIKHIPVVVWGQGGSRNREFRPHRNLYDKTHLMVARLADAYACYTPEVRARLAKYVERDKLFVATNTLDTHLLFQIQQKLADEGKESVKQRLGLERSYYLVFIGRLQARKRLPYLLDVYKLLKCSCGLDLGLLIIGKGNQTPLKARVAKLAVDDVHFLGALPDEEAGEYLFSADVMVIPGWLGLAVNHAFVFGLPVVSQRFGKHLLGHGPEASYVQHGSTGWFSRAGDKEDMSQGILHILKNLDEFSTNVLAYADTYLRVERMVTGLVEALVYAYAHR